MKHRDIEQGLCYAYFDGKYTERTARQAVPAMVVDTRPWVMEYYEPTRWLRKPKASESVFGELDQEFPTAMRGVLVLVGTHDLWARGGLRFLARTATDALDPHGCNVPVLGEQVQMLAVKPSYLHMEWEDHLVRRAQDAA